MVTPRSAMHSGDVPVLATPRLIALVEQASVQALGSTLGPEKTSVRLRGATRPPLATPVGSVVTADSTLESVEAAASPSGLRHRRRGLVAAGRITRVVVIRDPLHRARSVRDVDRRRC